MFMAAFSPFCLIFFVLLGEERSWTCLLLDVGGWFLRQLLAQGLAFADASRKLSAFEGAPRYLPVAPGLS